MNSKDSRAAIYSKDGQRSVLGSALSSFVRSSNIGSSSRVLDMLAL